MDGEAVRGLDAQLAPRLGRARVEAPRRRREQLAGVEPLGAHGKPALVGAGQHQQVLGELNEAVALAQPPRRAPRAAPPASGPAAARARARPSGARAGCAARGSRSATKPRSRSARALEALEHLVQRVAQLRELVAHRRARAAGGRCRAARSPRPRARIALDRAQRRRGDPVAGQRREQQRDRAADQQHAAERARAPRRDPRAWRRRPRTRPSAGRRASRRTRSSNPDTESRSTNTGLAGARGELARRQQRLALESGAAEPDAAVRSDHLREALVALDEPVASAGGDAARARRRGREVVGARPERRGRARRRAPTRRAVDEQPDRDEHQRHHARRRPA